MSDETLVHVIRKLESSESVFLTAIPDFKVVTLSIRVESNVDLFKQIEHFENAVGDWQRINPLLNAKIIARNKNGDYFDCADESIGQDDVEFYFYDPSKSSIEEFEEPRNLEFFYLNESDYAKENLDSVFEDDLCSLLIEREILREFNLSVTSNELLWRLAVVKLKPQVTKYNYMMLFSANHTILDGRSGYYGLLDLLNLVEMHYDLQGSKANAISPYPLLPPKEIIFGNALDATPSEFKVNKASLPLVINSGQDDLEEESEMHLRMKKFDHLMMHKFQAADEYSGSKVVQTSFMIGGLVSLSSLNDSKFKTLRIESDKMIKILELCKKNGTKVNGLLSVILSLAQQLLVNQLSGSEGRQDTSLLLFNVIGVAQFIDSSSEYHGNRCISLLNSFLLKEFQSSHLNEAGDLEGVNSPKVRLNHEKFWKLAQAYSSELHDQLRAGEHFKTAPVNFSEIFGNHANFGLSSFGALPTSGSKLPSDEKKTTLRVTDFILTNQCCADLKRKHFFAYAPSIDNNLILTLTFSSKVVSESTIAKLLAIVSDLFDQLLI